MISSISKLKITAILLSLGCLIVISCKKEPAPAPDPGSSNEPSDEPVYYLALGDSYTIGASVPTAESFPQQLAARLRRDSFRLDEVQVIARTGWTTDELRFAMSTTDLSKAPYDVVSLLIGVNNQYRGRSLENYRTEFSDLLQRAVQLAGNKPENVVVLSIPDYGVTPFVSSEEEAERIAREIDAFNIAAAEACAAQRVLFLNITPISREAADDPSLIAPDGLHPSGKMYTRWVEVMLPDVKRML